LWIAWYTEHERPNKRWPLSIRFSIFLQRKTLSFQYGCMEDQYDNICIYNQCSWQQKWTQLHSMSRCTWYNHMWSLCNLQVFNCLFLYCRWRSIIKWGVFGIPLTGLTPQHLCACLKLGHGFQRHMSCFVFFCFFYISMTWGAFFHNIFRCCSLNNNTRRWIVFHAMTYLVFYYFKIKVHLSFVLRKSSILYFYAVIDILGKTIQNNLCAYATFYSNALFLVPQCGLRMKAIHFPQSSVHKSG
jgi:hypothetical protein